MSVSNCKPFPNGAQERTCIHCGGTGRVWWVQVEYAEHPDCGIVPVDSEYEDWCPFCEGRGFVEVDEEELKRLRNMPYEEYLRTDHWLSVRERALEKAGHCCQVCNDVGPMHVHHRTYVRRGKESPEDLIVLCVRCHTLFHAHGKVSGR